MLSLGRQPLPATASCDIRNATRTHPGDPMGVHQRHCAARTALSCCGIERATRSAQRAVEDIVVAFTGEYICLFDSLACRGSVGRRLDRTRQQQALGAVASAELQKIISPPLTPASLGSFRAPHLSRDALSCQLTHRSLSETSPTTPQRMWHQPRASPHRRHFSPRVQIFNTPCFGPGQFAYLARGIWLRVALPRSRKRACASR